MKRNFSEVIKDLDGTSIVENGKEVTFAQIARSALMSMFEDEKSLGGEEKAKRFALAMKIEPKMIELTAEEVSLLKTLIGKAFGVIVVGQSYLFLEDDGK